ncbi:unnamed protein product, partial [Hapterophycus canaliculatus]
PRSSADPSLRSLSHFDRIPPDILTKLLRTTVSQLGEDALLEMVFDGVRLISCPVQLFPERGDAERTAVFFSLVFAVVSEYRPRRQLYPPSHLPKNPRKKEAHAAAISSEAVGSSTMAEPAGTRGAGARAHTGGGGAGGGEGGAEWGAIEVAAEDEGRGVLVGGGGDERERNPGVDLALLRGAVMMVSRAMDHEEWKNG